MPLFRLVLALWFTLSTGELGVLHACPMHGGGAPAKHGAMHAGHGGHASHEEHGAAHDPATPGHDGARGCTCIGDCGGLSGPFALAPAPTVAPARVVRVEPSARAAVVATPSRPAPYLLPFANGPPMRARIA